MIKLLHAADFHLDAPFRSLPAEVSAVMRAEQMEAVDALCRKAEELRVDGLLLAGDLFDGQNAFCETAAALRDRLGSLGMKVLISPGNHDHLGKNSPYGAVRWPENVYIFKTENLSRTELCGVPVYGAAFYSPWQERSPLAGFSTGGEVAIALLHGEVSASGRYHPIKESEAAASGLSYLALGHIHSFSGFERAGRTVWCQPGCLAPRGFDETGEKGAVLVSLHENGQVEGERIPLAGRRYHRLSFSLPEGQEQAAAAMLAEKIPDTFLKDLLRIDIQGSFEDLETEKKLRQAVRSRCFYADFRFSAGTERKELWDLADDHSLAGLAMQRLHEIYLSSEGEDREKAVLAADFLYAAINNMKTIPEKGARI